MLEHKTIYQNASEVRKNWSLTIDSVVHNRPAFIQRTHDYVAMLNTKLLCEAFKDYKFHVEFDQEQDNSITGFVRELDIVENASSKDECITALVDAMKDYAFDFYQDFSYWSKAPNRQAHIPLVLKLQTSTDEEIAEDMICQVGKN